MKNRANIAVLVSSKYNQEHPFPDDTLLRQALMDRGMGADIVVWDDPEVDFTVYDACIIRSCWDYDERVAEFLSVMRRADKASLLLNPLRMILQNSDKRYLFALQQWDIPIVPSILVDVPCTFRNALGWEKIVVKPTVSASGKDTSLHDGQDIIGIKNACKALLRRGKVPLLQKYFPSVESMGEHSSVIIDGHICFTMKKTPAEGNFLVHRHRGGCYTPQPANQQEQDFIKQLIDKLDETPLYMRIDYLWDEKGNICLLEMEQIEPYLYLSHNRESLRLLMNGLLERIQQRCG